MFVIVKFHFVAYLDSSICCILIFMLESFVRSKNEKQINYRRKINDIMLCQEKINKKKIKFLKPLEVTQVVCYNRKMTVIMDKNR